jgi:hypothetical protein
MWKSNQQELEMNTKIFIAMAITAATLMVACAPVSARGNYAYSSQSNAASNSKNSMQSSYTEARAQPSNQVQKFYSKQNSNVLFEMVSCTRKDLSDDNVYCSVTVTNKDSKDQFVALLWTKIILQDGSEFETHEYKSKNDTWQNKNQSPSDGTWVRSEIATPLQFKIRIPATYSDFAYIDVGYNCGWSWCIHGRFSLVPITVAGTSTQTPGTQPQLANTRAQPSNQILKFKSNQDQNITFELKLCIRKDPSSEEVTCQITVLNSGKEDRKIDLLSAKAIFNDGSEFSAKEYKFKNNDWENEFNSYVIRPEISTPLFIKILIPNSFTNISFLDVYPREESSWKFHGRFSIVPISSGTTSAQNPTGRSVAQNSTQLNPQLEEIFVPADSSDCVQVEQPVVSGARIKIEATGFATHGTEGGFSSVPKVNPNGDRFEGSVRRGKKNDRNAKFPAAAVGSLIGFIDSEDGTFFVGSLLEGTMQKSGTLSLCFNDVTNGYSDNTGGYTVKISQ